MAQNEYSGGTAARKRGGKLAYLSGLAAEGIAERHYESLGRPVIENRWRGEAGEIDLIAEDGDTVVFIEVKKSKTFDRAAESLSRRQMERIMIAAQEYAGRLAAGLLTEMRFDVALVNAQGDIRIVENAYCQ
ncbi:YraN family protein [Alphaproteobacteria bacterium KMM 3653]|uniref:UPF0102 protein IV417_00755 n=2 Tax=Harenicola maris TaxID=2841044 RepID=A0AAP2G2H3_9RHOB|nr:YraN family protein [Harenicola maris]